MTRVLTCPVNVAASTRSTSQPPASGIHSVACGLRLLRREVLQPEIHNRVCMALSVQALDQVANDEAGWS